MDKKKSTKKMEIKFPVAARYLRDSQMPDTMRWYPEYAWAIMHEGSVMGTAGIFAGGWYSELGSLWVHESIREKGWGKKLTKARVDYLCENRERFPDLMISRPTNVPSKRSLVSLGFRPTEIYDEFVGGDRIYVAYIHELCGTHIGRHMRGD